MSIACVTLPSDKLCCMEWYLFTWILLYYNDNGNNSQTLTFTALYGRISSDITC